MRPTETLKHEHQVILRVLDAAEREAQAMQERAEVRAERIEDMLDFFRNFADRCHHAKEEDLLFIRMEERGVPAHTGPIAVMLHEHDQGRQHLKAIVEALPRAEEGESPAVEAVRGHLLAYVRMLRAHIGKEDNILYPLADRVFRPQDQQSLTEAFERVEAEEIGEGVHEKYHQLARGLVEAKWNASRISRRVR